MKFALIDEFGKVVAFSDGLDSADDWVHPDNMRVVAADGFIIDPLHNEYDYIYENEKFVVDEKGIAQREAARPYDPIEVLSAVFSAKPDILDAIPDDVLAHMAPYMAEWAENIPYSVGDKVQYLDCPYRCLQPHVSTEIWNPVDASSLWARILGGQDGQIAEWEQPDSTNPYMAGDRVTHNGHTWESDVDNNVWEPGVYGWTQID